VSADLPSLTPTEDGVASLQLRLVSPLHATLRRGGGGRRDHDIYAHGATTMLALGLLLNIAGIGVFCWLIFTLAVYALPFFVAINVGSWAFDSGAGLLGTPLVAGAAGGITLAIARIAFAMSWSPILRAVIAGVFALPATFAGYHVALALAQIGVTSLAWQKIFACLGAVLIGSTAWMRLTIFTEPGALEPGRAGRALGDGAHPVLTAATRER